MHVFEKMRLIVKSPFFQRKVFKGRHGYFQVVAMQSNVNGACLLTMASVNGIGDADHGCQFSHLDLFLSVQTGKIRIKIGGCAFGVVMGNIRHHFFFSFCKAYNIR